MAGGNSCRDIIIWFFPSITAIFGTVQKSFFRTSGAENNLYSIYWGMYRRVFKRANIAGYFFLLALALLLFDLRISLSWDVWYGNLFTIAGLFLSLFFVFLFPIIMLVLIEYNASVINSVGQAFYIVLGYPLYTVVIGITIITAFLGMYLIPILVLLGGVSITALAVGWLSSLLFKSIESNTSFNNFMK